MTPNLRQNLKHIHCLSTYSARLYKRADGRDSRCHDTLPAPFDRLVTAKDNHSGKAKNCK